MYACNSSRLEEENWESGTNFGYIGKLTQKNKQQTNKKKILKQARKSSFNSVVSTSMSHTQILSMKSAQRAEGGGKFTKLLRLSQGRISTGVRLHSCKQTISMQTARARPDYWCPCYGDCKTVFILLKNQMLTDTRHYRMLLSLNSLIPSSDNGICEQLSKGDTEQPD